LRARIFNSAQTIFIEEIAMNMKKNNSVKKIGQRNASCASPGAFLTEVVASACLTDFPWLDLTFRPKDREVFHQWETEHGGEWVNEKQSQEALLNIPFGPSGLWARQSHEFLRWWRPHQLTEVFVETMYPFWTNSSEQNPPYVIVISSGPLDLYAVYLDAKLEFFLRNPQQIWRDDLAKRSIHFGDEALNRYATSCISANSIGKC
jgi:hypothetical protein